MFEWHQIWAYEGRWLGGWETDWRSCPWIPEGHRGKSGLLAGLGCQFDASMALDWERCPSGEGRTGGAELVGALLLMKGIAEGSLFA